MGPFYDMERERITEVIYPLLSAAKRLFQEIRIRHIGYIRVIAKSRTVSVYDARMESIIRFFAEKILEIFPIGLVVHDHRTGTSDILAICIEKFHLSREFLRMPDIVMILDGDIFPLCSFEQIIESAVWTDILFSLKKSDPRITELPDIFPCPIGRSIIENEHFEIGVCLIEYAPKGIPDIFARIIGTDEDRNFWNLLHFH